MTRTEFLALILTATIGFSAGMNVMSSKQPSPPEVSSHVQPPELIVPAAPQEIRLTTATQPLLPSDSRPPNRSHQIKQPRLSSIGSLAPGTLSLSSEPNTATQMAIRSAILTQHRRLQVIAHNLANVNTTAFKRERLIVESSSYDRVQAAGALDTSGNPGSMGIAYGHGVRIVGIEANFSQGTALSTGNQLDLLIEGNGFFQVTDAQSGETFYTRTGNFQLNANGDFVLGSAKENRLLEPAINIPSDATDIVITSAGEVQVRQPGTTDLSAVGTIELATFINPQGLENIHATLYRESGASGTPTTGTAGLDAIGRIRQGSLEKSNVEPIKELLELDETRRQMRWLQRLRAVDTGGNGKLLEILPEEKKK